ncbi:MAG: IPT/TIG domain-containing protein [Bryobacteraceae bacterium]
MIRVAVRSLTFFLLVVAAVEAQVPKPIITSISPSSVLAGSPPLTITVNGRNFRDVFGTIATFPHSEVRWNGEKLSTHFVNETTLTAQVPQPRLSTPGTADVTVVNFQAGPEVISDPFPFYITTGATLRVTPTALAFTAAVGAGRPQAQRLLVTASDGGALPFTVRTSAPWLLSQTLRGATPAAVYVAAAPGTLPAGTLNGTVFLDSSGGTVSVPVSFQLEDRPARFAVSPQVVRLRGRRGTDTATLVLRNEGGGGAQNFTAALANRSPWLRVTPESGQIAVGGPAQISVSANLGALQPGAYQDVVRLSFTGSVLEVPVTLSVFPTGASLRLFPLGSLFEARAGAGTSVSRNVLMRNAGDAALNWSAQILNGRDWLTLGATTGNIPADGSGSLPVSVSAGSLGSGIHHGLIRIASAEAVNSPAYFHAVFNVSPADASPRPVPSPSGLFFTAVTGGPQAAAQAVRVFTSSATPIAFQVSTSTDDGSAWLSASPTTGNTSTQATAEASVSVNSAGLKAGVYTGDVNVSLAGTLRSVNVLFIVQPAPPPAAAAERQAAGCTPTKLVALHTGLVNNFATAAAWPTPLAVRVLDDCGDAAPNSQVVVNFSNGDAPLAMQLTDATSGVFSGTWVPANASALVAVTATASAPNLALASIAINGEVAANKAPILLPNATVHAFAPRPGGPLAPATAMALYGSDFATSTASASPPYPKTLNGVSVIVGGVEAPLYYVSPGQINAQLPAEHSPDREYQILVLSSGALTAPDSIAVNRVSPGTAAYAEGGVIAQNAVTGALITSAAPARPEEYMTIYLTGLGATNPAVPSGAPAPAAEPLARVVTPVTVTLDGVSLNVLYAGLTPNFAGLYQVNFQIPANARTGNLNLVVRQDGVESITTLPVRQ